MAKYLLAEHALTGCDIVSYLFGIGKATALKALMSGNHLNVLGQLGADEDNLMSEVTAFIAACYDSYIKRTNSKITSAPKLKSLPPTHAFVQHVIWKSATQSDPPDLVPIQNGWQEGEDGATFYPITFPPDVSPAPVTILKLIKCGCSISHPCSTGRCGCVAAQMSCSMFGCCNAGQTVVRNRPG